MKNKSSAKKKKVAIIGSGFGGMSAAYDLALMGYKVTIFDGDQHPGGLASGFKKPEWDWYVEKYYHHWFASDRYMLGLIDELGWHDKVLFQRPYTVLFHNGKFYPFDSILTALTNPILGWGIDKIRFGLVGLYLKLSKNWKELEKVTAESWIIKWAGKKVYKSMWEPLLQGKFGERYMHNVNMAWFWARFHARTTRLGTFEGGFQAFANAFQKKLIEMGVEFQMDKMISKITTQKDGSIKLHVEGGGVEEVESCLVTSSPGQLASMAGGLPKDYLAGLLSLKHMGAVVLILSLRHQLSTKGYYWFNLPKSTEFPFLALVEHTNFLPAEKFGGDHIVYIGDYLDPEHEHFHLTKEALLKKFLPGLARINPEFKPEWINETWLFRTKYAQPVPMLSHSENIPSIRTPIGGLYFASMSQVYPWDRGTNYAVEIGRRAARAINDDLSSQSS